MSAISTMALVAVQLLAFQNGVCWKSCKDEGYNRGGHLVVLQKVAYCECTDRFLYSDLTAEKFTLQWSQGTKDERKSLGVQEESRFLPEDYDDYDPGTAWNFLFK